MAQTQQPIGSAARWGRLFGAHARDWAETWEGPAGWGNPVYRHILDGAKIGSGTRVLDCGCGAGRFARMAADRGGLVAGIDAATEFIDIAAERTPDGDFRTGELEALPWPDHSFDVVTGFSAFQFADDKIRAIGEAGRVSRDLVVVVIPARVRSRVSRRCSSRWSPVPAGGTGEHEAQRHVRSLRAGEARRAPAAPV